jgi:hypothetical protein
VKRFQAGKTVDSRLGAKLAPASIEDAGLERDVRHQPINILFHSINRIDEFLLRNLAVQFFWQTAASNSTPFGGRRQRGCSCTTLTQVC